MEPRWHKPKGSVEQVDLPSATSNLTCAVLRQSCTRLVQVEYPGLVQNPERALRTLGGIHKVSQVLGGQKKRLELRFRPGDIYCKAAYGDSAVTCGLLIKLRRRKSSSANESHKSPGPQSLIELSHLEDPPEEVQARPEVLPGTSIWTKSSSTDYKIIRDEEQQFIVFDGPLPADIRASMTKPKRKEDSVDRSAIFSGGAKILAEEEEFLQQLTLKKKVERAIDGGTFFTQQVGQGGNRNRIYVKVPENLSDIRAPRSNFHVEVLGVIPRSYKFHGMCDFQYLPMKKIPNKKRYVSLINKIIPTFPNPDAPNVTVDDLIVCDIGREGHGSNIPSFLVPSIMSRVDKPVEDLVNYLEGSICKDLTNAQIHPQSLITTRAKRVIYSNLCNFRKTDNLVYNSPEFDCLVPEASYPEASRDAGKRGLLGTQLDLVKSLFERRGIWTKIALEHESNLSPFALKYILPCVAYFALNGPWRSCWIRFGYDPRKDRFAYAYQLLDYRVPHPYRAVMERKKNTTIEVGRESLFSFKSNTIPPKCQMIYQLCEIRIKEVDQLNKILEERMGRNERVRFEPRYGFLTEDIIEYCRYCISRNIELFLFETGRIQSVTLPEISLPMDGEIPPEIRAGGMSKIPQLHSRVAIGGEKRRLRPRTRPFPYEDGDDASNQSSNIGDLKIRVEEISDDDSQSESDDLDEDQRIMNEALEATSGRRMGDDGPGGSDDQSDEEEEMDIESLDPDQILGLESD